MGGIIAGSVIRNCGKSRTQETQEWTVSEAVSGDRLYKKKENTCTHIFARLSSSPLPGVRVFIIQASVAAIKEILGPNRERAYIWRSLRPEGLSYRFVRESGKVIFHPMTTPPPQGQSSFWKSLSALDWAALGVCVAGLLVSLPGINLQGVVGIRFLRFMALIAVFYLLYRFCSRWRSQLLWSLRNRLIVAYLFIAVVPIILLLILASIAGQ